MSKISSQEIRLASRPQGMPTPANFTLARRELEPLPDRQVFPRRPIENTETVVAGIGQAVGAFPGLFAGKNIGKRVVKLA
jgi:NADPH-dependent curcumin reductase CurA